jgi:hypothetical protein
MHISLVDIAVVPIANTSSVSFIVAEAIVGTPMASASAVKMLNASCAGVYRVPCLGEEIEVLVSGL